ncbi:MAG: carbon monoxide dehydrogenase [Rhodospirillaceae bacterium]|nr:carbon monoxide dehydrogenase [Rhodospirillaceae bacterium]
MTSSIGKSILRLEDNKFLKGLGEYTDDISFLEIAHMYIIRSVHPAGIIKKICYSDALKIEGVLGIYTFADIKQYLRPIPSFGNYTKSRNVPMFRPQRQVLADEKVVYAGQPIVCIVAETIQMAKYASDYVSIEFEIHEAVIDIKEALNSNSPKVWKECKDNISFNFEIGNKKEVDQLFSEARYTFEIEHEISRVYAAPLENRSAIGNYDKKLDKYTLYSGTQAPHNLKKILSNDIFSISESKIRVVSPDMGGAFGMRSSVYPEMPLVMLFSKLIGLPIKWCSERSEGFLSDDQARDNHTKVSIALDENYNFLSLRVNTLAALGAYISSGGSSPPTANLGGLAGVYKTKSIYVNVKGVFTNTMPTSAYRGAGRPEASFAIERIIDHAAYKLNLDPAFLRKINTITKDLIPYKTGLVFEYDSGNFIDNLDKALSYSDYDNFDIRRKESEKRNKLRGFGIANVIERSAAMGEEDAQLKVNSKGNIDLFVGTHSHGQGHETVFKQIIAEKIGVNMEDISFYQGDTDLIQKGFGTFGSRSVSLAGSAIINASKKIIDKGKEIAAFILEANSDDIKFENKIFSVVGTDKKISWSEVSSIANTPTKLPKNIKPGFSEIGSFSPLQPTFPNGCHCAELEIDKETGEIKLINYVVVDDVGHVLNPLLLKGQIHGGVVQGLGQILMEEVVYDKKNGQLVTGSFMDYCMPRAADVPFFKVYSNPCPTKINPLGVKGAGEAGTVGSMPAIMNAIYNILYRFGIESIKMPVTSEKIWKALQKS